MTEAAIDVVSEAAYESCRRDGCGKFVVSVYDENQLEALKRHIRETKAVNVFVVSDRPGKKIVSYEIPDGKSERDWLFLWYVETFEDEEWLSNLGIDEKSKLWEFVRPSKDGRSCLRNWTVAFEKYVENPSLPRLVAPIKHRAEKVPASSWFTTEKYRVFRSNLKVLKDKISEVTRLFERIKGDPVPKEHLRDAGVSVEDRLEAILATTRRDPTESEDDAPGGESWEELELTVYFGDRPDRLPGFIHNVATHWTPKWSFHGAKCTTFQMLSELTQRLGLSVFEDLSTDLRTLAESGLDSEADIKGGVLTRIAKDEAVGLAFLPTMTVSGLTALKRLEDFAESTVKFLEEVQTNADKISRHHDANREREKNPGAVFDHIRWGATVDEEYEWYSRFFSSFGPRRKLFETWFGRNVCDNVISSANEYAVRIKNEDDAADIVRKANEVRAKDYRDKFEIYAKEKAKRERDDERRAEIISELKKVLRVWFARRRVGSFGGGVRTELFVENLDSLIEDETTTRKRVARELEREEEKRLRLAEAEFETRRKFDETTTRRKSRGRPPTSGVKPFATGPPPGPPPVASRPRTPPTAHRRSGSPPPPSRPSHPPPRFGGRPPPSPPTSRRAISPWPSRRTFRPPWTTIATPAPTTRPTIASRPATVPAPAPTTTRPVTVPTPTPTTTTRPTIATRPATVPAPAPTTTRPTIATRPATTTTVATPTPTKKIPPLVQTTSDEEEFEDAVSRNTPSPTFIPVVLSIPENISPPEDDDDYEDATEEPVRRASIPTLPPASPTNPEREDAIPDIDESPIEETERSLSRVPSESELPIEETERSLSRVPSESELPIEETERSLSRVPSESELPIEETEESIPSLPPISTTETPSKDDTILPVQPEKKRAESDSSSSSSEEEEEEEDDERSKRRDYYHRTSYFLQYYVGCTNRDSSDGWFDTYVVDGDISEDKIKRYDEILDEFFENPENGKEENYDPFDNYALVFDFINRRVVPATPNNYGYHRVIWYDHCEENREISRVALQKQHDSWRAKYDTPGGSWSYLSNVDSEFVDALDESRVLLYDKHLTFGKRFAIYVCVLNRARTVTHRGHAFRIKKGDLMFDWRDVVENVEDYAEDASLRFPEKITTFGNAYDEDREGRRIDEALAFELVKTFDNKKDHADACNRIMANVKRGREYSLDQLRNFAEGVVVSSTNAEIE